MSNLENFNNMYANLAESAYMDRPSNFPPKGNSEFPEEFNYGQDALNPKTKEVIVKGGIDLPNNGIVFLQPDPTVHTVEAKTELALPNPNGGYHTESYVTSRYQKGLLTDEKAGFNAYFVTDTEELSSDTKNTYLAIRGSDEFSFKTSMTGWTMTLDLP